MFEALKEKVITEGENRKAELVGTSWWTRYLTPAKAQAYKDGKITEAEARQAAEAKHAREVDKATAAKIADIEAAEAAPDFEDGAVCVRWHKSRVWGYNPSATFYGTSGTYSGSASGCGYDKRSAAVAEALNQDIGVRKMLYKAFCDGRRDYGACLTYGGLPAFEGGVGVDCFWRLFRACGYEVKGDERARDMDYYDIRRAAK